MTCVDGPPEGRARGLLVRSRLHAGVSALGPSSEAAVTPRSANFAVPSPDDSSGSANSIQTLGPTRAGRVSWQSVGTGVVSTGVPAAVGVLHPFVGVAMAIVELRLALPVIGR